MAHSAQAIIRCEILPCNVRRTTQTLQIQVLDAGRCAPGMCMYQHRMSLSGVMLEFHRGSRSILVAEVVSHTRKGLGVLA